MAERILADTADLAERVSQLSPAERLRLAAALIDAGRLDMAELLIERVSGELALLALEDGDGLPIPGRR